MQAVIVKFEKGGKDNYKGRLEATYMYSCICHVFIWSGKLNFYQGKVREFWKLIFVATILETDVAVAHNFMSLLNSHKQAGTFKIYVMEISTFLGENCTEIKTKHLF